MTTVAPSSEVAVIPPPPTVYQAVNAVMADISAVRKDSLNRSGNFNFRGIDAVMNACGPAFRKHGVMAVPEVVEYIPGSVTTRSGAVMTTVKLKMRVRFYGPTGDFFDTVVWGESFDAGDKATAKAHSVAYRTALLQTLCLPTDEADPDSYTYDQGAPQDPQQPPQDGQAPQPQADSEADQLRQHLLELCHAADVSPHKLVEWAMHPHGGAGLDIRSTTDTKRLQGLITQMKSPAFIKRLHEFI